MIYKPWPYQTYTTHHIIDNPAAGAFLDMGLGKTVSTLTAIDILIYRNMEVNKVLVIAPKKVAENVWTDEVKKWDHLSHLRISRVIGTERQRKAALFEKADIYVIGVDNVAWLVALYQNAFPFDMVVIDESSLFKNHQAKRFTALKQIRPLIDRVVILTGTPAPNGLIDLWAQMYLLDRGKRLGELITGYRERFFEIEKAKGYVVYKYKIRDGMESIIYQLISDVCISMKTEDYLVLPERIDNIVPVYLPDDVRKEYKTFERDKVLELKNQKELTAVNATALSIKLTQFANGAVYDQDKKWHQVHDEKITALQEIIDAAQGKPVLIFYWFQHDIERLKKAFKGRILKTVQDMADWNAGLIPIAFVHPASAGHGLNLQYGGSICVWFGLTWDLQLYQQANKRLHRQGQVHTVIIHHLIAVGTMDEDIMQALTDKAASQDALLEAIIVRMNEYGLTG